MKKFKNLYRSLVVFVLSFFVFTVCVVNKLQTVAFAESDRFITLNSQVYIDISGTSENAYYITLPDSQFYVVETKGNTDTYLKVVGLSTGNLTDDDSGSGLNACVGFRGEGRKILIKVSGRFSSTIGSTKLQIRKQQAAMFGFQYPASKGKTKGSGDINTAPDLEKPASALQSIYEIKKYNTSTISAQSMSGNDERGIPTYNSEILFFSGHGYSGDDGNGNKTYGFGVSFPAGDGFRIWQIGDMCNTKIAVWAACYSANQNNSYNSSMVHRSVEKGAKAALGWADATNVSPSKKFTDAFFTALSEGKTVSEAAEKGKSKVWWPWDAVRNYVLVGNGETIINSPIANRSTEERNMQVSQAVSSRKEFIDRINEGSWIRISDSDNQVRYYKTINECLTNDFYEVKYNEDREIVQVTHSGIYVDDGTVLTENVDLPLNSNNLNQTVKSDENESVLIKYESHKVYVSIGSKIVPVLIEYNTYADSNGSVYLDAVCTNLNDGTLIDYAEIC